MSDLLLCRIDPDLLYPEFLHRLQAMQKALQVIDKLEFWAISGYRSEVEQMKLWTQGRTKPGTIVTNAKALESAHNFGIAADLVKDGFIDRAGLQPDWRAETYEPLRKACPQFGLEWGGSWKNPDRPHVQMPGWVTAKDLAPLAEVWKNTEGEPLVRLGSVWQYLSEHPH